MRRIPTKLKKKKINAEKRNKNNGTQNQHNTYLVLKNAELNLINFNTIVVEIIIFVMR